VRVPFAESLRAGRMTAKDESNGNGHVNYAHLKVAAALRTGAAGSQGELRCSAIQPTVSTRETKARAQAASRFGSLRTGLFSGSWGLVQEDSAKRRI
jgi:hypothetical protein